MIRVLCIGLDGRVADPEIDGHAVRWSREMARLVDEYVVISESRDGKDRGPVSLAENAVAWRLSGGRAMYPFRAARLAMRLHCEIPFHVVTTEDPIRAGLAGLLFSRQASVPLNVENHSLHINEPVWLASRHRHRLLNRVAIRVTRGATTIRNYSPDQVSPLLRIGVPAGRLFVIPPPAPQPIHTSRAEARALFGIAPDEEIVLAVGRMVPYKNISTLLDAFALLRSRRPVRLLLAGDGPSRARWQRQAAKLGLSGSVSWLGGLPDADVSVLYAAADVFVAPALHETGPRTVMEAFMAGCPVVATPAMGVAHARICTQGETALLVPPTDPMHMAEAVEMLLEDPGWARRMAGEGRSRTERECEIRLIARKVAGLLRETARRSSPSPEPAFSRPAA